MSLEQPEKEPVIGAEEIERLKESVDVVAEKWNAAARERLKNNLQYPGIGRRYREIMLE